MNKNILHHSAETFPVLSIKFFRKDNNHLYKKKKKKRAQIYVFFSTPHILKHSAIYFPTFIYWDSEQPWCDYTFFKNSWWIPENSPTVGHSVFSGIKKSSQNDTFSLSKNKMKGQRNQLKKKNAAKTAQNTEYQLHVDNVTNEIAS